MIFIAYILIAAAALALVYFGSLQGDRQFYMSVFSAAIVIYCIYLDFKKRMADKKENKQNPGKSKKTSSNIKKNAHSKKKK